MYTKFLDKLPEIISRGRYDIIAPYKHHFYHTTVLEWFDEAINVYVMKEVLNILESDYSDYYSYFNKTLKGCSLYAANISIMRDELYDEYCTFVFSFFDKLEVKLLEKHYYISLTEEKAMHRIFGYIGELLMSTFITKKKHEGIRVKECTLLFNSKSRGNDIAAIN